MPKVDFSKGKIYAIKSYTTDKLYIGATTANLTSKLRQQKRLYAKNPKSSECPFMLQFEDVYIRLIKEVSVTSREELLSELDKVREEYKTKLCFLNLNQPTPTPAVAPTDEITNETAE
jgi:hypothetical protein